MSDERVLVVTGTHRYRADSEKQLIWFCDTFWLPTRTILGDATGVDTRADIFFRRRGLTPEIHRAKWRVNGFFDPGAGFDRNEKMIVAAPVTAHLLAIPLVLNSGQPDWLNSPGTLDCYTRGKAKGLTCHIR